jgi:hypothetical protein
MRRNDSEYIGAISSSSVSNAPRGYASNTCRSHKFTLSPPNARAASLTHWRGQQAHAGARARAWCVCVRVCVCVCVCVCVVCPWGRGLWSPRHLGAPLGGYNGRRCAATQCTVTARDGHWRPTGPSLEQRHTEIHICQACARAETHTAPTQTRTRTYFAIECSGTSREGLAARLVVQRATWARTMRVASTGAPA